jgi:hypothetical protein
MIKPASLERLRDISKQRSIRRPLLVPVSSDHNENAPDQRVTKIEWPISG